jgi:hypothetical protein
MPEPRSDDRSQARREAAILLGVDINHLSAADGLRVDMISALRLVIDYEQAAVLDGGGADLGKLNVAVASLIALLPNRELPSQERREDPRAALLALILQQRERAGVPDEGTTRATINALTAENAQLKARLGDAPTLVELDPDPPRSNVVPDIDVVPPCEIADRDPGQRPGPDDRKPPVVIEATPAPAADADALDLRAGFSTDNSDQSWRNFATDVDGVPLSGRGRRY